MYKTANPLNEETRKKVCDTLNSVLADSIDLYTQIKVAHWNIKGPHFAHLHPLFDEYATAVAGHNDEIAERAVVLGDLAIGTARQVAKKSSLAEYEHQTIQDLKHVELLLARFTALITKLHESRKTTEDAGDVDTTDLLTAIISEYEKNAWFLGATLNK